MDVSNAEKLTLEANLQMALRRRFRARELQAARTSADLFYDHVAHEFHLELSAIFFSAPTHVDNGEITRVPATWWDAFKERWFPAWLERRFPVQRRTIVTAQRHFHLCPHHQPKLPDNPYPMELRPHLDFLAERGKPL